MVLAGATATGKSAVAQLLAERRGAAVLSADSMLVYRGMDIGTAKPTLAERGGVEYFGIDLVDPDQMFNTGRWIEEARLALQTQRNTPVVVAGGTGLYLKALTEGLQGAPSDSRIREEWRRFYEERGAAALRHELESRWPDGFSRLQDVENPRRLLRAAEQLELSGTLPEQWRNGTRPRLVGLRYPREVLCERVARRVDQMFEQGLIDEVRHLRDRFPVWSDTAAQAIGYAETVELLDGRCTLAEAKDRIVVRTRQLAKRQETWFRHQAEVDWVEPVPGMPVAEIADRVEEIWEKNGAITSEI